MEWSQHRWPQLLRARGRSLTANPIAIVSTVLLAAAPTGLGCGVGRHSEGDNLGRREPTGCVQTMLCAEVAHWDPKRCRCVLTDNADGGTIFRDGGCVPTEVCTQWAYWSQTLCRCVVEVADATLVGAMDRLPLDMGTDGERDAGSCCPAAWSLYRCQFPDGGMGLACHNPALGCASSSTCGQGCDPVVSGPCAE